ncbi:ricin B lectin domain-containing protein [Absidia repens]|uniref:Ricin B lectin domain-containing protein n=1 Tax=Absidia repens TaxID=90262 RepID=A0A1X2IAR9_9FUNG|nr:ricin B lectin domain-containing protein [Absidia repens]
MFPKGLFYILSRKHGFALDVYDGQTKEDANIIVWPQKFEDSDNQLWTFDEGRLVNKKSGHVLDVRSSVFKKDKAIVQCKRKDKDQSQFWQFDQGFICSQEYPSMVFDIKKDNDKGGAHVILYKRKNSDNLNQQWYLEPYHNIESSLNMAVKSVSLHKKEGFGQPQHGYGAQIGVPPELKVLPNDIKVVGVGNNVASSPTLSKPLPNPEDQNSSQPEALTGFNQAPSSTSSSAPPQAEPGFVAPSSGPSSQQQYQGSPPPPAPNNYPPSQPYPQQQQGSGHPASQAMPSPGVGGFYMPQAPQQQTVPSSYPMPSEHQAYPSYPPT